MRHFGSFIAYSSVATMCSAFASYCFIERRKIVGEYENNPFADEDDKYFYRNTSRHYKDGIVLSVFATIATVGVAIGNSLER